MIITTPIECVRLRHQFVRCIRCVWWKLDFTVIIDISIGLLNVHRRPCNSVMSTDSVLACCTAIIITISVLVHNCSVFDFYCSSRSIITFIYSVLSYNKSGKVILVRCKRERDGLQNNKVVYLPLVRTARIKLSCCVMLVPWLEFNDHNNARVTVHGDRVTRPIGIIIY